MRDRAFLISLFCFLVFLETPYSRPWMRDSDNRMVLSESGYVLVTVNNVITNTCNGTSGLFAPEEIELFPDYNNKRGASFRIGPFDAGTELIFYIAPWSYCSGFTYLSDNPAHAHVNALEAPNAWRIDWEDLPDSYPPDNDFDDLILVVTLIGSGVPDFKQDDPQWKEDPYDRILEETGATIGNRGCAVTSVADILHYYGAYEVNPQTLDDCLSTDLVSGYNSGGGIIWDKAEQCSNPLRPRQGPSLIEFKQKVGIGDVIWDSDAEQQVVVTKQILMQFIEQDLTRGWPVILELGDIPESPSGVHYVVATGETGQTFSINDPKCGSWPECPASRSTLAEFGEEKLRAIVRYEPSDGEFRQSLFINGLSPIEFNVTDPEGRRIGYSPTEDTLINEIPDSNYYFQPPVANFDPDGSVGDGMLEMYILDPLPGMYTVNVFGIDEGEYSLIANMHAAPYATLVSQQKGWIATETSAIFDLHIFGTSPPSWEATKLSIPIDIQPNSRSNRIHCDDDDYSLTVAILSSEFFNAVTVDHKTVSFEGAVDARLDQISEDPLLFEEDVDDDGDTDLVFRFQLGDTTLSCDSTTGYLVGKTLDGTAIEGRDAVSMVEIVDERPSSEMEEIKSINWYSILRDASWLYYVAIGIGGLVCIGIIALVISRIRKRRISEDALPKRRGARMIGCLILLLIAVIGLSFIHFRLVRPALQREIIKQIEGYDDLHTALMEYHGPMAHEIINERDINYALEELWTSIPFARNGRINLHQDQILLEATVLGLNMQISADIRVDGQGNVLIKSARMSWPFHLFFTQGTLCDAIERYVNVELLHPSNLVLRAFQVTEGELFILYSER